MKEPHKTQTEHLNSAKIKQMSQVLEALSYLNQMVDDDEDSEISILLDSTYNILDIAYNNLKKIHLLKAMSSGSDPSLKSTRN